MPLDFQTLFGLSLTLGLLVLLQPVTAQPPPSAADPNSLYLQAVTAYELRDYAKSIELALAALESGATRGTVPYHLACCYALTGQVDDAFEYLKLAIDRGWRDLEHLQSDLDLESLRKDTRWAAIVDACSQARDEYLRSVKEPKLARELMTRMARDQALRRELERRMQELPAGEKSVATADLPPEFREDVDAANTEFMKATVEKYGWPGKSLVGEEAAQAAWLLVQHADADREFQDRCLGLIRAAFDQGEVTGQQVAYLTDRVLVGQGKQQRYGTQFQIIDGETKLAPLEDEEHVDDRRKDLGLPPLAEYVRMMRGRS